jgi:hypothetical protein
MSRIRLTSIAVAALTLAACAQVPTSQVDAAKQAVDSAKAAQAPDYAPDAWSATNDAQAKLDAELKAQDDHWAPLRSYAKAQALAAELKDTADKAAQNASSAKEKAKSEASSLIAQAHDEYDKAQKAVGSAPHGKGTEADLASLKSDATGIDGTIQDAQKAFDSGDYLGAKTKAQAAISSAQQIEKEVETAKQQRHAA